MKTTTFGKKGGVGPTRGLRATRYVVTLPDGKTAWRRSYAVLEAPVGFAYQHAGEWHLASIAERGDPKFGRLYTECPAELL
jgi:hypothetical protein